MAAVATIDTASPGNLFSLRFRVQGFRFKV